MKKTFYSFLAAVFMAVVLLEPPAVQANPAVLTNDTMVTFLGDSFWRGLGYRMNFVVGLYYITYHPTNFVSFRDHSQSGQGNFGYNNPNIPQYVIPEFGAGRGKTNGLLFINTSGNGRLTSNQMYSQIEISIQVPTNSMTTNGVVTNDWPFSNGQYNYDVVVIGDTPYYSAAGDPSVVLYSDGGKYAALAGGKRFVDSYRNLSNCVVTYNGGYPANSNLFFENPIVPGGTPRYDHVGNPIQGAWAFTTLTYPTNNQQGLGVDTNAFTMILDATTMTVESTNHCYVSSLSGNRTRIEFDVLCDRMAPGFWISNNISTNDLRGAFTLIPALGNAFCEIMRVKNLLPGTYKATWDATNSYFISSEQLSSGHNLFTNYTNPMWESKQKALYDMCVLLDVSSTNLVDDLHVGDNRLIEQWESGARALWPTNTPDVGDYTEKMIHHPFNFPAAQYDLETPMLEQDKVIHADVQQVPHHIVLEHTGYGRLRLKK